MAWMPSGAILKSSDGSVHPEADVDDLIIKRIRTSCGKHLDEAQPDQQIELTTRAYKVLLEHIEVHRYYMGHNGATSQTMTEAAASWYDNVYSPVVRRSGKQV
jgi:hypothetical protein